MRQAADGELQTALAEKPLKDGEGVIFARRRQSFAEQQIAAGVVGDGERVAVLAIA